MLICIETHRTCDFPGGPDPLSPHWVRTCNTWVSSVTAELSSDPINKPKQLKICIIINLVSYSILGQPQGGTLIFSAYVGSDPASTVHPKKYQKFQAPQKNIWHFCNTKNIPILYIYLRKDPKIQRNNPLN